MTDLLFPDPAAVLPLTDAPIPDAMSMPGKMSAGGCSGRTRRWWSVARSKPAGLCPDRSRGMGTVGFGGDLNGLVDLSMSDEWAEDAVGEILGMSPAEVASEGADVRKDGSGEVTHRTGGGFENARCQLG